MEIKGTNLFCKAAKEANLPEKVKSKTKDKGRNSFCCPFECNTQATAPKGENSGLNLKILGPHFKF